MKFSNIYNKLKNLFTILTTSILGTLGGQGYKYLRRYLIPLLFTSLAYNKYENLWVLTILSLIGCYSLGYGEDSFIRNIFKGNNYLTRGFIGLLKCISLIILPIINGKWVLYFYGSIILILVNSLLSWRDLGVINIKDKELLISDLIIYGLDGLFFILIL